MMLNKDMIRDILIELSQQLVPNDIGIMRPINPMDFVEKPSLNMYEKNEMLNCIRTMMDEKIIIQGEQLIYLPIPEILDISMKGYQFIDATKELSTWEKIKPKLTSFSIETISDILKNVLLFSIT